MRTSHIITAAIFSTFAMSASPAFADRFNDPETVVFELDLTASETVIYDAISEQARRACAADRKDNSVLSRAGTTRKCQKRLIANIVEALDVPVVTVLAKADGVKLKDG